MRHGRSRIRPRCGRDTAGGARNPALFADGMEAGSRSPDPAAPEKRRVDAVIPCHDAAVLAHAPASQESWRSGGRICHSERIRITSECFDKRKTYDLAERLSIPLPKQSPAASLAEIEELAGSFGMPLVLKPAASVSAEVPEAQCSAKVRRREDIEAVAGPMLARGPLLIQQNFVGIGRRSGGALQGGRDPRGFSARAVHEPLLGGRRRHLPKERAAFSRTIESDPAADEGATLHRESRWPSSK